MKVSISSSTFHLREKQEKRIKIGSQGIIPRLEAADFVYRYSWFITRQVHYYPPSVNLTIYSITCSPPGTAMMEEMVETGSQMVLSMHSLFLILINFLLLDSCIMSSNVCHKATYVKCVKPAAKAPIKFLLSLICKIISCNKCSLTSRYGHDFGDGGDWYLDGSVNNLFEPDSDQMTSVGQLYNNLQEI